MMIAWVKAIAILSAGVMMGYWLACLMIDSSEQSRKEEELLREEMSINRKYEGYEGNNND